MRFTYRYERRDFVQTCMVMTRNPIRKRLIQMALWLAFVLCFIAYDVGSGRRLLVMQLIITGGMPGAFYAIVFGVLAILWFRAEIYGWLIGAPYFRHLALANREVTLDIDESGVRMDVGNINMGMAWSALKRVIETPYGLVFALSSREAIILPRRAVAADEDYDRVRERVRRHVPGV